MVHDRDSEQRLKRICQLFAANLTRLRNARGVTQADLCDEVGIAPRTIRGLEGAHYNPSFRLMAKLAIALDVDAIEFFRPAEFERRAAGRPKRRRGRKA